MGRKTRVTTIRSKIVQGPSRKLKPGCLRGALSAQLRCPKVNLGTCSQALKCVNSQAEIWRVKASVLSMRANPAAWPQACLVAKMSSSEEMVSPCPSLHPPALLADNDTMLLGHLPGVQRSWRHLDGNTVSHSGICKDKSREGSIPRRA